MKKLNNKGFTLVELLAVLVILIAIMSIAIPSISSSLERSKDKQDKSRRKLLESAAELYVTDHKNKIKETPCAIKIKTLLDENYIDEEATKNTDGDPITEHCVIYDRSDQTYEYNDSECSSLCVSD